MIHFHGNDDFLALHGKKDATFLLAGAVTQTCEIEGITQAGIPGLIHLTPTLDGEFVDSGKLYSLGDMATTPKGVPTPAIITRAVKNLTHFSFEMLDVGLRVKPQVETLHDLGIVESKSIQEGAGIDAKAIIQKGEAFAQAYAPKSLLILGESTPSGTTSAYATAKALGFQSDGYFSSSFLHRPQSLKEQLINDALERVKEEDIYTKLGAVSDNMLLFCAGFVAAYSQKAPVILAGGTQMAAVLLLIDRLGLACKSEHIALMTTSWVYHDSHSDIKGLLEQLSFEVAGYASDFTFEQAHIPVLKLYDEGEAKEGVGAGGALCYAQMKGFDDDAILAEIERVLSA